MSSCSVLSMRSILRRAASAAGGGIRTTASSLLPKRTATVTVSVVRPARSAATVSAAASSASDSTRRPYYVACDASLAAILLGAAAAAAGAGFVAGGGGDTATVSCDGPSAASAGKKKKKNSKSRRRRSSKPSGEMTPSRVDAEDFSEVQQEFEEDEFPVYTAAQVARNNGEQGRPVWMTYGGVVYNVTDFIANHPGGSEKISQAAGSAIEPYWHLYRQHFASDLPMKLMEHMAIGRLAEEDQDAVNEALEKLEEDDPYAKEPLRHRNLIVHSDQPCNAEVPGNVLTSQYLTPNSLFYIRHHHPVPYLTPKEVEDYRLKVDLRECGGEVVEFSLKDIKKMPKTEVTVTLQCSGNRRSGFNAHSRTSGTPWGQGAISTAKFTGVRLIDLMKAAGMPDPLVMEEKKGIKHVRFHAMDGMSASIGTEKAFNPYGDVILCYRMNGDRLPRDHGFPLRVIVPGYAAVRNVKWVERIEPSREEADGPWQRGLNYKTLPPSVTDAKGIDLDQMPSMTEVSVFSGITEIENDSLGQTKPGDRVKVKARGWAWAGGGRNVVRVDLTSDDGASWATAKLKEGSGQKFGRAWAWVFWECEIPDAVVREDGSIRLASKAVDLAFNVQPENSKHGWNVRGLGNNAWYRESLFQ